MKVYYLMSYDYLSRSTKLESAYKTLEGACEAMHSLADDDVGDGTQYRKRVITDEEVNVHYIPDEVNMQPDETVCKSYFIL